MSNDTFPVNLNIYDLWPRSYSMFGLFHAGVAIDDIEFSYSSNGILREEPKAHVCFGGGRFVKEIHVGRIDYSPDEVELYFICIMRIRWKAQRYQTYLRNCILFATTLLTGLVGWPTVHNEWSSELEESLKKLSRYNKNISMVMPLDHPRQFNNTYPENRLFDYAHQEL